MARLLDEFKYDLSYLKSHTLQPKWFKVAKILILLGFLVGYTCLFGLIKTLLFFTVLILSSSIVRLVYRVKTNRRRQSWLDFIVIEENGETETKNLSENCSTWMKIHRWTLAQRELAEFSDRL